MTTFEREMLIETCRAACRNNVLRTEEERAELWAEARKACELLEINHPEDAVMLLIETTMTTKFEPGKTYACRSACDHECVWTFTVSSRTAKTIKTTCGKSLRINAELTAHNNAETVFPLGRYSMAPILTADKVTT